MDFLRRDEFNRQQNNQSSGTPDFSFTNYLAESAASASNAGGNQQSNAGNDYQQAGTSSEQNSFESDLEEKRKALDEAQANYNATAAQLQSGSNSQNANLRKAVDDAQNNLNAAQREYDIVNGIVNGNKPLSINL